MAMLANFTTAAADWPSCSYSSGNYRCYANAKNGDGQTYHGAILNQNDANMYLNNYSQGQHINSEMWFYTSPSQSQWVETGLRNGYDANNSCQCVAYEAFWGDEANGNFYRHPIANYVPDQQNHVYEIQKSGNTNNWAVFLDNNYQGVSTVAPSSVGYSDVVGSEISLTSPLDSTTHADTFNMYMQNLRTSSYSWYYWPSLQIYAVQQGCGSTWHQGQCQNAATYASYEWSWNKP
jgi:hypothetical protein